MRSSRLGRVIAATCGVATFVGCALAAGACSSSGGSADAGAADNAAQVTCMTDPRRDELTANLTKAGKNKLFQFVLTNADPAPPGLDVNTWTVKVLDAAGAPVSGATLTVAKPYMPLHLHASSQTPEVTAKGDGTFTVGNLDFFMVGLFQVTLTATSGAETDSADLFFCVQ